MKYIEGVDYWVRLVEFPNTASPSVAVSNGDGTFTIYVNSRCSPGQRERGLRHELEHLAGEHFYRDDQPVSELERAADGLITLAEPVNSGRPEGMIPLYESTAEFLEHFLRRASPESLRLLRLAGALPDGKDGKKKRRR